MVRYCVGDPNCSFSEVIKCMSTSTNFEGVVNKWRSITTELDIQETTVNRIANGVKYEASFTATAIVNEILHCWRGSKSTDATLDVLIDTLDKLKMEDMSNKLRERFEIPVRNPTTQNIPELPTVVTTGIGQGASSIPSGLPPPYEQFSAMPTQLDPLQQNVVDGRIADVIENIIKRRIISEENQPNLKNDSESSISSTQSREHYRLSTNAPQQESLFAKCTSAWLKYVEKESQKTARDPHTNKKVAAWLFLMLLACYYVHASDAQMIQCDPCVKWSIKFCGKAGAISAGCLSMFPNVFCATVLTAGSSLCAGAAGTCTYYCAREVWTQGIPTE